MRQAEQQMPEDHLRDDDEIDAALVHRARNGDDRAFGDLVRRHERRAQQLAAFVIGSTSEVGDVTQEAFLLAYTRLAKLEGERAFRPWLMRIVANTAKNRIRAASRRTRRDQRLHAFAVPPALTPDEHAVADADADALWRALGRLDNRERVVIALRFAAGMSEAETAAVLGIPAGTVKSRMARGMATLRSTMGATRD